jgi:hypothetical protein
MGSAIGLFAAKIVPYRATVLVLIRQCMSAVAGGAAICNYTATLLCTWYCRGASIRIG